MGKRELLREEQLTAAMKGLPKWKLVDGKLRRELKFADFVHAFGFMAAAAVTVEAMNHHPDWRNVWNQVTIELWTHDAGGITSMDTDLAAKLEALAEKLS